LIKVNLLPGGKRGASKGARKGIPLPKLSGLGGDRWLNGVIVLTVIGLGYAGYLFMGLTAETEELTVALDAAAADSARYAEIVERNEALIARRDSIAERVGIIQGIDQGRYVWPHLLDEVARALPDYTWLTGIVQIGAAQAHIPDFRIRGRSGNNFALTRFMENLEASPFIRAVQLVTTELVVEQEEGMDGVRTVHDFTLEASYELPPPELIETVPLLGQADVDSLAGQD
jgi:Tfp pilus assembly protein PilN